MAEPKKTIPICLLLRHKKMFYADVNQPPTEDEKEIERLFGTYDATVCWCELTQTGRGPDEQPVNKPDCSNPGRRCYKGLKDLT
jgi:hypothetical protein